MFKFSLSEERLIENYNKNGNDPARWKDSANALCVCYNILWGEYKKSLKKMRMSKKSELVPLEFDVLMPALMLLGYAIECYLKAIWVKSGNILAKNGKFNDSLYCKNHDLKSIAEKVKITLDKDENNILLRLSSIIISIGRYPIGKSYSSTVLYWGINDSLKIKQFIDRLLNELSRY